MELAPLVTDTTISANWIIAAMMALLIFMIKRSNDRADIRERKIDEILEKQNHQLEQHEKFIALHQQKLESYDDIMDQNRDIYRSIMLKLGK